MDCPSIGDAPIDPPGTWGPYDYCEVCKSKFTERELLEHDVGFICTSCLEEIEAEAEKVDRK